MVGGGDEAGAGSGSEGAIRSRLYASQHPGSDSMDAGGQLGVGMGAAGMGVRGLHAHEGEACRVGGCIWHACCGCVCVCVRA